MINRQMCPIMSFQRQHYNEEFCAKEYCALWDEKRNQCCFKTQALAAVADPLDRIREQAMYTPARPTTGTKPQDPCYNGERIEEIDLADQYIFNGGL